jgi:CheY-like chemotaxis protein
VDDDRQLLKSLCAHLERAGHNCASETNGARAYKLLEEVTPDVILLDVMIPGMSGFEFCRRVRSHNQLYATPIIFMSSMSSEEEIQHALSQGADDFMPKPLRMDQVQQRVAGHVAHATHAELRDEATGLPGKKQVKIDLQRILTAKVPFSIMYVEMVNLAPFGRSTSEDLRLKALRHFSRALKKTGHGMNARLFRAGHMGAGYFVVVLDTPLSRPFCEELLATWTQYLPRFYSDLGLDKAFTAAMSGKPTGSGVPLLDLLICHTEHIEGRAESPADLLETLSNIRQRAVRGKSSGIFFDRRTETNGSSDMD